MSPMLVKGKGVIFVEPPMSPLQVKLKKQVKKILKKHEKQGTKSTVSQIMELFKHYVENYKSPWTH